MKYTVVTEDRPDRDMGILIDSADIMEVIYFPDQALKVSGVSAIPALTSDDFAAIRAGIIGDETGFAGDEVLASILAAKSGEVYEVAYTDEWESAADAAVFVNTADHEVFTNSEAETTRLYRWFDGSNQQRLYIDPDFNYSQTAQTVETDDDHRIGLDEYRDGNHFTETKFSHEWIAPLLTLDECSPDGAWLHARWTQWQGNHIEGIVLTAQEVLDYVSALPNADDLIDDLLPLLPSELAQEA